MYAPYGPVRWPQRRAGVAGAALIAQAIAGCSTLSPQIFSPRFDPTLAPCVASAASAPASSASAATGCRPVTVTIDSAIDDAVDLQGRYLKAVREHSELGAGSSAALIVVSALAVFKGVTHPSSKDLAGLGVLGSGAYVYASTMVSRARQQLYLAGAESLECAVAATRPYHFGPGSTWVSGDDGSLEGRIRKGEEALAQLVAAMAPLQALQVTREFTESAPKREAAPECQALSAAPAPPAASGMPANDRERLAALRQRNTDELRDRCKPTAAKVVRETPNLDGTAHLNALKKAQRALERLVGQARRQLGEIDGAGNRLWSRTTSIQLQVAAEVLKTEPDITAVRNAAQSLKAGAISLAGAGAFPAAPTASAAGDDVPTGKAHASGTAGAIDRRTARRPDPEIDQAQLALNAARGAHARLDEKLGELKQRLDAVRTPLDKCGSVIAQRQLTVAPGDVELEVGAGQTQAFLVSGGSGIPSGNAVTDATKATRALPSATIEGGQFKLVYTPPDKATDGQRETVTLVDGSGQLQHVVHIVVRVDAAEK